MKSRHWSVLSKARCLIIFRVSYNEDFLKKNYENCICVKKNPFGELRIPYRKCGSQMPQLPGPYPVQPFLIITPRKASD